MRFRRVLLTYLSSYLLIIIVFIGTVFPLVKQMEGITRDRIVAENEQRLETAFNHITEYMSKLVQTSSMLCTNRDFLRLAALRKDESSVDNTIYMLRVKNQTAFFVSLLDHVASCVLTFPHNDLYLSNTMISGDYHDVYGTFLQVGDLSVTQYDDMLSSDMRSVVCLPERLVRVDNLALPEPMLMFKTHGSLNASMYGICTFTYYVNSKTFLQSMITDPMDVSFATLLSSDGVRLTGIGAEPDPAEVLSSQTPLTGVEPCVLIQKTNSDLGITIIVGVPESLINENTRILMSIIPLYLLTGLLLAVVLVVVYSLWHFKSVRQLITVGMRLSDIPYQNTDGYRYIRKAMERISSEREHSVKEYGILDNAYLDNLLNTACMYGLYSEQEIQTLERYVGKLTYYYIAVIKYSEPTEPSALLKMEEALHKRLQEDDIISVHPNARKMVLILSGSKDTAGLIGRIIQALDALLGSAERVRVGVSDGLSGVEMIHVGYQQAHQALRFQLFSGDVQGVARYQMDEIDPILIDISTLRKLSDLVYSAKPDGVRALFSELRETLRNNASVTEEQFRELFYALRMALLNIVRELKVDLPVLQLQSELSYLDELSGLEQLSLTLIAQIEAKQRRGGEALFTRIHEAMEQMLENPALNAAQVAAQVGCSEKYIFRVMKEGCGRSFGDELERLRLQKTEALLLSTQQSNEQIAQSAGFASQTTFYRSFRKAHGVTPGAWRAAQQLKGGEDGTHP